MTQKRRKSTLGGSYVAQRASELAPAQPEPSAPAEAAQAAPEAKKPAAKKPAVKKPGKRPRPTPPAGTEELAVYWPADTYTRAIAAYQVLEDQGAAPTYFVDWLSEAYEALARLSVTERVAAVQEIPVRDRASGLTRRHHIPTRVIERMYEAMTADREQLANDRSRSAFAALAGQWATEKIRRAREAETGEADLPEARPLPRGRKPDAPR